MPQAAAKTGIGPTVTVAVEQHFPENQRILEDNLAYPILPLYMRVFVCLTRPALIRDWMVRSLEKPAPGIWSELMCRKRYIDEKLVGSVNQIDAVVNLGAGFDTRAYRLKALGDTPVWEVDFPDNIKSKRKRLRKLFGEVPNHIKLVSIDFEKEELGTVLKSHDYSLNKQTFFVLEAVTQYIPENNVMATFDFLRKFAPGSRLAFTYVRKDFIDGQVTYDQEELYNKYVVKDKIWLSGMDPERMEEFLEQYGWRLIEHRGYEELADRYVKPTGRDLASSPIERMVYAEKL